MSRIAYWAVGMEQKMNDPFRVTSKPAPILSKAFALGLFTTMRPYLLFISGITGLLGMSFVSNLSLGPAVVVGTVFFLAYGFGQALTDCFQVDTDSISSPYRPLVRGEIDRRTVLLVSLAGLLVSGVVLMLYHRLNLPIAAAEIAGLLSYTWMKRRWWGGPPHNAWIVAGLVLMGLVSAAGAAGVSIPWNARVLWALCFAFFGYGTFVVVGYHKDVEADRATGYSTLPVRFGRRASSWVADGWAFLAFVSALGLLLTAPQAGAFAWIAAAIFAAAGTGALLTAQVRLHGIADDDQAHRAVEPTVHGYVLWASAGIALQQPGWIPFLLLYYAAFVTALRLRPAQAQI